MNILRPSSLTAIGECPAFRPGPPRDYTNAGTARHEAAAAVLRGAAESEKLMDALPEDDRLGVQWFVDFVRLNAPMSDYLLEIEKRIDIDLPNFERIHGTPDVVCGPTIFDLKWRRRAYVAQMAAYALGLLQRGHERVTAWLAFADSRQAEKMVFTRESAEAWIEPILSRFEADGAPTPCDYCGWCANVLSCPALVNRAEAVRAGRDDWSLPQYHASKIETPDEAGAALHLARALSKWCEAVEHHAKEMLKAGKTPTGFREQTRQGNRFIASVADAFALVGLPQDVFLAACEAKFSALVEAHRSINSMPKAAAERDIEAKLGDVLQRRAPSTFLVEDKTNKQKDQ